MKTCKTVLVLLVCFSILSAASAADKIRTVADIPGLPLNILKKTLSSTIYKHLIVSPVQGWIAVGGQLSGTRITGARVIHSELDGAYDQYALQIAKEWRTVGYSPLGKTNPTTPVVFDVLIYEIADGTMVLTFPYLNEPGGTQNTYAGAANLAVQERNGQWRDLPLGAGSLTKVWAIRNRLNTFGIEAKLNPVVRNSN